MVWEWWAGRHQVGWRKMEQQERVTRKTTAQPQAFLEEVNQIPGA